MKKTLYPAWPFSSSSFVSISLVLGGMFLACFSPSIASGSAESVSLSHKTGAYGNVDYTNQSNALDDKNTPVAVEIVKKEQQSMPNEVKAKIEGRFTFESGFVNQNKLAASEKKLTSNQKNFGIRTDAIVAISLANTADNGLKYGGKLSLQTTTKVSGALGYTGSHIFLESDYGKVELGSPYDAGSKMRISGDDPAATPKGGWNSYAKLGKTPMQYDGAVPEFSTGADYYLDSTFKGKDNQLNDKTEAARKVSYFTPKIKGFQFGVSYIPDSANTGIASFTSSSSGKSVANLAGANHTLEIKQAVKNAFSAGVSYEGSITDGVDIKLAATGEYGKSEGKVVEYRDKGKSTEIKLGEDKLTDLKTYNLGATLAYGNFSYGISYGNLMKSLTSKKYNLTGRNTDYYSAAIAYGQGPIKTSVSYFRSNQYKNIVDSVSVGTEYKLAPGLMPYAEISYFQAKGRPSFYPEAPKKTAKGTVALIGARLKF